MMSSFNLRTRLDDNGDPWFVTKNVCNILGIKDQTQSVRYLDDDERNTLSIKQGNRGNPMITLINESGLYSLTLGYRKPEAKSFKKRVTSEVLPSREGTKYPQAHSGPCNRVWRQVLFGEADEPEHRGQLAGPAQKDNERQGVVQRRNIIVYPPVGGVI